MSRTFGSSPDGEIVTYRLDDPPNFPGRIGGTMTTDEARAIIEAMKEQYRSRMLTEERDAIDLLLAENARLREELGKIRAGDTVMLGSRICHGTSRRPSCQTRRHHDD